MECCAFSRHPWIKICSQKWQKRSSKPLDGTCSVRCCPPPPKFIATKRATIWLGGLGDFWYDKTSKRFEIRRPPRTRSRGRNRCQRPRSVWDSLSEVVILPELERLLQYHSKGLYIWPGAGLRGKRPYTLGPVVKEANQTRPSYRSADSCLET
jgi:hypothetical protein